MQAGWLAGVPPPACLAPAAAALVPSPPCPPQQIVTFDAGGVSGHPNHRATCAGVLHWWAGACSSSGGAGGGTSAPDLWQLHTEGLLHKYAGPLGAPLSWARSAAARPIGSAEWHAALRPARAWRALLAHRSQIVWYRRLWALFSSYMYACMLVAAPLPAAPR